MIYRIMFLTAVLSIACTLSAFAESPKELSDGIIKLLDDQKKACAEQGDPTPTSFYPRLAHEKFRQLDAMCDEQKKLMVASKGKAQEDASKQFGICQVHKQASAEVLSHMYLSSGNVYAANNRPDNAREMYLEILKLTTDEGIVKRATSALEKLPASKIK